MILLCIICAVSTFLLLLTAIEIIRLIKIKPLPDLPEKSDADKYSLNINGKSFEDLYLYLSGKQTEPSFSENEIYSLLKKQAEYMNNRFDCADFRAQMFFKIYKDCKEKLNENCRLLIKETFLNFKYFIDEPGDDSMCYWSENHQILFAVSEYLAGQEWPDEVFTNNGMSGREHMKQAENRIDAWMEQRFNYGFSEYLSNNYLAEDIAPMANFIAYANDINRVERMKIIMDILWLDVALNSVNNRFVAVSSRMYGNNKAANCIGNSIQSATDILWGNRLSAPKKPNYIVLCFTDAVEKGLYVLPDAIKDIALSKDTLVSKMTCGLSPDDMVSENLIGQSDECIMAQTGAETFTNHQVIRNTLAYLRKNNLFTNKFLSYFKFLNLTILKGVDWEKFASKHNIMPHGIALGRGNVYTFRNAYYSMSTDVCKAVGDCGAQEHIWTANISDELALFTTHPAGNGNGKYGASPGYWIGNGRRPMSVQNENVNITIYELPRKKRLGESDIASMTHVYMPKSFYDEFELDKNMVFARKGNVFVSVVSNGSFEFKPFNPNSANGILKGRKFPDDTKFEDEFDLCRFGGDYHMYVTELSDSDIETFDEFKSRIRNNQIEFSNDSVNYITKSGAIDASYSGGFSVDGNPAPKEFDRYDSKFCKAKRKADSITVDSGKNRLFLDFKNAKRSFNGV